MRTPDVSSQGELIFWLHLTAFIRVIKGVTNLSAILHKKYTTCEHSYQQTITSTLAITS